MKLSGWITTVVCLVAMVWMGANDGAGWKTSYEFNRHQTDYYNLLVDGFLDGHLYLKVETNASGELPYLLDATRYQGKYYLYFGAVPAVLLMAPFSCLTGYDLPDNACTLLLVVGGFVFNLRLYLFARRRYFSALPAWWDFFAIPLLAFGAGTPILVFDASFYEIAIASGYFCISATLLGIYQAIHSSSYGIRWLAFASLTAGLAVGSRPTYLFALPLLLVPVFLWWRRAASGRNRANNGTRLRGLIAAIGPAALVGIALVAYNYGRFKNPFEFGHKYQVNALTDLTLPFSSAGFIWPNLKWYYLTPPVLSPYFPYVLPIDALERPAQYFGYELVHGQWLAFVLGVTCAVGAMWSRRRSIRWPVALKLFVGMSLVGFALVLVFVTTFGVRANRYAVDFQGFLIVAVGLAASYVAANPLAGSFFGRWFRTGFCVVASLLALFNVLVGIQWMDHVANTRPKTFQLMAYYGNYPSHWLHQWLGSPYGHYRLHVRFTPKTNPVIEPLVTTGVGSLIDELKAYEDPSKQVQFAFQHTGGTEIRSALIPIEYDHDYLVEVRLGSLYPPIYHPFFNHWKAGAIAQKKREIRLVLDGREILRAHQEFHDAWPSQVRFGINPVGGRALFSGKISGVEFVPDPPPLSPNHGGESGVWRLPVEFPLYSNPAAEPLLASGVAGHGNLLNVHYLDAKTIRFDLDQWNYGFTQSEPITLDDAPSHLIEIFVGPRLRLKPPPGEWHISPAEFEANATKLKVWFDHRLVWTATIIGNADSYDRTEVGSNSQGFSSASPAFSGQITNDPLSDAETKDLILRALAAPNPGARPE